MMNLLRRIVTVVFNRRIRKWSFLTRLLFGVKGVKGSRIHWDFTTLLFKGILKRAVSPGFKVLEIGTGPYAILSIYAAKMVDCGMECSEINEHYIENARETARLNKVHIEVVESDLFEGIDGKFDIIFWNSLYIPYDVGIKYGMDRMCEFETDWCGGEEGSEKIESYLKSAADHLKDEGRLLLGFNSMYLSESTVRLLCERYGYDIEEIHRSTFNPSRIAVLVPMSWSE
jgi:release factor glutamine methyltransferase